MRFAGAVFTSPFRLCVFVLNRPVSELPEYLNARHWGDVLTLFALLPPPALLGTHLPCLSDVTDPPSHSNWPHLAIVFFFFFTFLTFPPIASPSFPWVYLPPLFGAASSISLFAELFIGLPSLVYHTF